MNPRGRGCGEPRSCRCTTVWATRVRLHLKKKKKINRYMYYAAIKRNEILLYATTWVNLENIMLSERNQTQKTTHYVMTFLLHAQNREMYRDRK